MNYAEIKSTAVSGLRSAWGETAELIIELCNKYNLNMNCSEFLGHCTACGGNWTGMYCSGIKELCPDVYAALPETLGKNGNWAFVNLGNVLQLLGVRTWE